MTKTAFITGVTGQDGSFLAELLLSKGYEVYGLVRRLSSPNITNIKRIMNRIHLPDGDMTDQSSMIRFIEDNWSLGRLGNQSFDALAGSVMNMFDFHSGLHTRRLILDPLTGNR